MCSYIMVIMNFFATLQTESQWSTFLQKAIMRLFQSWNELFPFYKARASASPRQFSTCTNFLKLLSSWKRKASTFTRRDEALGPTRPDKFSAATTSDLGGFNLRSTHS